MNQTTGMNDKAGRMLLDVDGLQVELITDRGVIRAVDGVSFQIRAGETVTLIGESGSGKSTTAMAVLRLLPEDLAVLSGRVSFLGQDVVADPRAMDQIRGRTVSLIPQDPMTALNPVASIGTQLREAISIRHPRLPRPSVAERARELLEQVRIPDPAGALRKYPHQLSGGMLQRVLIATALAGEPELLVADEPTSALDVTVQAGILDLLMDLQERSGIAILMITHDLGVARLVSDRIHVMREGRFVESGPAARLVEDPAEEYTRSLLAAVPRLGHWDEPPERGDDTAAPGLPAPGSGTEGNGR